MSGWKFKVGDRVYLNHVRDTDGSLFTGTIYAIQGIIIHIDFDVRIRTCYSEQYVGLLQVTMVDVLVHNKEYKDARKVLNV